MIGACQIRAARAGCVRNVLLASADQVAIDAVTAKIMGFDPIKFIRLVHEQGLGCEWSLKTVLAPWACVATVLYHDTFWYPIAARARMQSVRASDWGRLFQNWSSVAPDERGFPHVGARPAPIKTTASAPSRRRSACLPRASADIHRRAHLARVRKSRASGDA